MDRESKRLVKLRQRDERIQKIYEKIPALKKIDDKISENGRAMLVMAGSRSPSEGMEVLRERHQALLNEHAIILQEHELDEAIFDVAWDCPLCEDRGYQVPGQRCICAIRELREAKQAQSGLAPQQLAQTFENFSIEYYKNRAYYENVLSAAKAFAETLGKGEDPGNLLFYGEVGTGKTHLCSAIANKALEKGSLVHYVKSSRLFDWIRQQMFGELPGGKNQDPMQELYTVDLLILDDLGTEGRTDFVEERLYMILEERIIRSKPWIISTNFSIDELCQRYDARITDRILGEAKRFRFEETSIRRQKLGM